MPRFQHIIRILLRVKKCYNLTYFLALGFLRLNPNLSNPNKHRVWDQYFSYYKKSPCCISVQMLFSSLGIEHGRKVYANNIGDSLFFINSSSLKVYIFSFYICISFCYDPCYTKRLHKTLNNSWWYNSWSFNPLKMLSYCSNWTQLLPSNS